MTVLYSGQGPIPGQEYLPLRADEAFWGRLPSAADSPILSVASGTTVTVDTLSHEGILEDQGRDPIAFFTRFGVEPDAVLPEAIQLAAGHHPRRPDRDGPHVVTGPIEVRGAQPGDLLAVTVLETDRRVGYGVISSRHGKGALPDRFPGAAPTSSMFVRAVQAADGGAYGEFALGPKNPARVRFPLAPFPGIVGVAIRDRARPHSVPPGAHGGNLDIKLLTTGSTLYLPVQVPGALAYLGDPHFAQGDGEVALTAVEASLRVTVQLDVIPAATAAARFGELLGPVAETADYLIPTGLDPDLDLAMANCVRAAVGLLEARFGMDPAHAYAYLSAATDFDVSQVVDLVKGVHARIRKADFERW